MMRPHIHRAAVAMLISVSTIGMASVGNARPASKPVDVPIAIAADRLAPERQVEIVSVPQPLPLPGQLKPMPSSLPLPEPTDPGRRVNAANAAARVEPSQDGYLNAIQQYPYADGALYQLYAAPGQVTDIALQEGEQLVGAGPVAAGDTARWIIGDTISGTGASQRVHILVKPTRPGIFTNLVINTDRRTYHVELRATPSTYMASLSWTYPQDQLIALRKAAATNAAIAPVADAIDVAALDFRYRIEGDRVAWKPLRAFNDGRQAFIEFPATIAQDEMPPLFLVGTKGDAELVNYRVQGRFMIVDRLFSIAELRLGGKRSEQRVRIIREDGGRTRR
ncbi:P-type conjugative transfer protein TrbG [Sphingopyxis sp. R3-92]|uniref:P-type conjugative transfer protein TrbG n=1 Tax=Sphingopyxis sp. R3-92 TaxID=3158553 RepID=UPI003EE5C76E